ncbi:hypothetical protein CLAIMM_13511 [Cladophialophora immunda]|nr:hypothetical protein CLAIMM_13511 [Cladophialophora immunda]
MTEEKMDEAERPNAKSDANVTHNKSTNSEAAADCVNASLASHDKLCIHVLSRWDSTSTQGGFQALQLDQCVRATTDSSSPAYRTQFSGQSEKHTLETWRRDLYFSDQWLSHVTPTAQNVVFQHVILKLPRRELSEKCSHAIVSCQRL